MPSVRSKRSARLPAHDVLATHFALCADNFDEVLSYLRAKGVAYGGLPGTQGMVMCAPTGVRGVYLEDPDGHWIEINDHH